MGLRLRKSPFTRNKRREKSIGDIFNKASSRLSSAMSLALTIFFTPALMATSLFSQEIVLMLINLCLCLGNLSNFGYRVYQKEVGKIELAVTLCFLAGFIAGAYFLFPAIVSTGSWLAVVALANQFAAAVNLFFLLRNNIVPPIIGWFKYVGATLALDIQDTFHSIKPLDAQEDAYIVNALMQKHFHHSFREGPVEADLNKLNRLLKILENYTNKYHELVWRDTRYSEAIKAIEGHIRQLTLKGNADSSFSFIRQKIAYKEVKRHRLQQAQTELQAEDLSWQQFSKYCKGIPAATYHSQPSLYRQKATSLLAQELKRQQAKIDQLSDCLP
ncbi:MAG: hypothetical protein JJT82_07095 [Legionellaceae bacterium]|nr:hypothetical protein [Legionellaceae bacterium]